MSGNYLLLFIVLWPLIGGFASYGLGRRSKSARNLAAEGTVILELLAVLFCAVLFFSGGQTAMAFHLDSFGISGLHLTMDGFRAVYLLVTAFLWMVTTLFSREYMEHYRNRNRYYLFHLLTLGATTGLFLSADLMTVFLFFELMSLTSYVWVAQEEKEEALRAGGTYLAVAVIGGLIMLMGLFLLQNEYGTLNIAALYEANLSGAGSYGIKLAAGICLLIGFGAKAGMFPLHIWLPKAHPVAPAPASALLSGILTKTGIFGILIVTGSFFLNDIYWGKLLLVLGTVTMLGGAVLALFSVDMKRILACSSMSQIGFILVGVGMQALLGKENALAAGGTVLHMVNHSLFKLLLFVIAGVVVKNLHKLNLNDIRGFGRNKPLLHFCFLMGVLGISGIPLLSGYVSKTLLHESIVEYMAQAGGNSLLFYRGIEWIFLITGGLTIAYMAKLYIALFWEKGAGVTTVKEAKKPYWSRQSAVLITAAAILVPVFGILPHLFMEPMAAASAAFLHANSPEHPVRYLSAENLRGAGISLLIGIAVYFGFVRTVLYSKKKGEFTDRWPAWLDLENLIYRPLLLRFLPFVAAFISRVLEQLTDAFIFLMRKTILRPKHNVPERAVSRTTYVLGTAAGGIENFLNKTFFRRHPKNVDFVAWLTERQMDVERMNRIITRSLSFGLLMFCIGLCLTIAYLLFF